MCPAHIHTSKTEPPNTNTDTVEVGLSLLAQAHMPLKFRDAAFLAATFLINRTSSMVMSYATPLERLYKVQPNYSALRIFGCACWPNVRPYNQHKFLIRASRRILIVGFQNMAVSVVLYLYDSDTSCDIPPLSRSG
jgi:hypothetical protein